jgi:hypothetical protein
MGILTVHNCRISFLLLIAGVAGSEANGSMKFAKSGVPLWVILGERARQACPPQFPDITSPI